MTVVVDPALVDPGTVRIEADLAPLPPPRHLRGAAGGRGPRRAARRSRVACVSDACRPGDGRRPVAAPARAGDGAAARRGRWRATRLAAAPRRAACPAAATAGEPSGGWTRRRRRLTTRIDPGTLSRLLWLSTARARARRRRARRARGGARPDGGRARRGRRSSAAALAAVRAVRGRRAERERRRAVGVLAPRARGAPTSDRRRHGRDAGMVEPAPEPGARARASPTRSSGRCAHEARTPARGRDGRCDGAARRTPSSSPRLAPSPWPRSSPRRSSAAKPGRASGRRSCRRARPGSSCSTSRPASRRTRSSGSGTRCPSSRTASGRYGLVVFSDDRVRGAAARHARDGAAAVRPLLRAAAAGSARASSRSSRGIRGRTRSPPGRGSRPGSNSPAT